MSGSRLTPPYWESHLVSPLQPFAAAHPNGLQHAVPATPLSDLAMAEPMSTVPPPHQTRAVASLLSLNRKISVPGRCLRNLDLCIRVYIYADGTRNEQSGTMNKIQCSSDTPWGIHLSLEDHQCPRCGWTVDRPEAVAAAAQSMNASGRQGWRLLLECFQVRWNHLTARKARQTKETGPVPGSIQPGTSLGLLGPRSMGRTRTAA